MLIIFSFIAFVLYINFIIRIDIFNMMIIILVINDIIMNFININNHIIINVQLLLL